MSNRINTSVVIVNRNQADHLKNTLKSVFKNKGSFEVIMVDDYSGDNSVEVAEQFPVKLIQNKENLGPSKSRNIAAKEAKGKYILFLDSDMKIDENYIQGLMDYLETHPDVGIVSGKIVSNRGERLHWNFGHDPSILRDTLSGIAEFLVLLSFPKNLITPFSLNHVRDEERKVHWVRESAFMIRRDLFDKLGGFDEKFFMYAEGPDLCRRIRKNGFQVCYYPAVSVRDLGGHTYKSILNRKMLHSTLHYYKKHPKLF